MYKQTVALIRAYTNITAELEEAGYSQTDSDDIKAKVDFYLKLWEEIKNASGETLDMKTYEADMRHLIDTYIQAEEPRTISPFADMSLLGIIVSSGIAAAISSMPEGIKANKEAVAEAIENNVRRKIIKEHLIDPAYFEKMSKLLNEVIKERKAKAINYEEYLKTIADLSKKVSNAVTDDLPDEIRTNAQRALYHNLVNNKSLALEVDEAVKRVKKADWRGNLPKENEIKAELLKILKEKDEVERLFSIIKQQSEY